MRFSLILVFTLISFIQSISFANEEKEIVKEGCEDIIYKNNNKKACLLLHGLGGCPHEVSKLAKYLSENNFDILAPRYPGHGSHGKFMSKFTWLDWYKVAEKNYKELKKNYEKVYVLGFSTGGTLTLKLAQVYDIDKIVLISPFIKLTHKWFYIFNPEIYVNAFGDILEDIPSSMTIVNLNDKEERKNYVRGDFFSIKATKSTLELINNVSKDLKKVNEPTLLIHSKNDETVDYESSLFVYNNISSKQKEIVSFEKSNHIVILDYDKDLAFRKINKFLN